MADRLSADKELLTFARDNITAKGVLGFKNGDNTEVYMLAFVLGVDAGYKTPSKHKEGFILESVARGFNKYPAMSFIYSVALQDLLNEDRADDINNTDVVFRIAEEYANTGFKVMKEFLSDFSKYDEETLVYELIEKLDSKIKDIEQMNHV